MPPTRYWAIECRRFQHLDFAGAGPNDLMTLAVSIGGRLTGVSPLLHPTTQTYVCPESWHEQRFFSENVDYDDVAVDVEATSDVGDAAPVRRCLHTLQVRVFFPAGGAGDLRTAVVPNLGTLTLAMWSCRIPSDHEMDFDAPRQTTGTGGGASSSTIALPGAYITEITDVLGLYEPGYQPMDVPHPKLAERHQGYKSEDDAGRIYLNRDLQGAWQTGTEMIEIAARVRTINRPRGVIFMKWRIREARDPLLMDPAMHRDARAAIEGATQGKNEGPWPDDPWVGIGEFPIFDRQAGAVYTFVNQEGESRIRIGCPRTAGDRFAVYVSAAGDDAPDALDSGLLVGPPRRVHQDSPPQFNVGDRTGIMTMWQRIDVEVRKMTNTPQLPTHRVAPSFAPARIQLDFLPVEACSTNVDYLGAHDADCNELAAGFVDAEFLHDHTPGYFCLLGIREFNAPPLVANPGAYVHLTDWELQHDPQASEDGYFYDYIDISPDDAANTAGAEGVKFEWFVNQRKQTMFFHLGAWQDLDDGWRRHYIVGETITKVFPGGAIDGLEASAYQHGAHFSPTGYQDANGWHNGGYRIPRGKHTDRQDSAVWAHLSMPGDYTTSGFSPGLRTRAGAGPYFGARTVVAMLDGSFIQWSAFPPHWQLRLSTTDDYLITIVHELTHGFGLPHRCAEWDWRRPRTKSCVMNYSSDWVVAGNQPLPDTAGNVGVHFCATHIKELRRVRLDRNPALMEAWTPPPPDVFEVEMGEM